MSAAKEALRVSLFSSECDNQPELLETTWHELASELAKHEVRESKAGSKAWSPATFRPGTLRARQNVESVSLAVFDVDHSEPGVIANLVSALSGYGFAIHSTFSHTDELPSLRVVMPLSRAVRPSEWEALFPILCDRFGIPADRRAKDPGRIFFAPCHPPGATPYSLVGDGLPIDVVEALDSAPKAQSRRARDHMAQGFGPASPEVLEAARAALREHGPAIDGSGGDAHTVRAGMILFNDFALTELEAQPLVAEWNQTCRGPWEEAKLWEKLENGRRSASGERGSRRQAHYKLTDVGNAERFRDEHVGVAAYVPERGNWYVFDGVAWRSDLNGSRVTKLAVDTVRRMHWPAIPLEKEALAALVRHALASENANRLEAMMRLASRMLAVSVTELDRDPDSFNVLNGTLDLRTGMLRPHDPRDRITSVAPVGFDAAAQAPNWERFLGQVLPSPELRAYVQRAVGYSLTGHVSEQVLFFLYGAGANGKSTFITTIQAVVGSYARQAPAELLLARTHGEQHPTDVATLAGARMGVCSEVEDGRRFAEQRIKSLTGGDVISARFMHQDFFSFSPTHKLWLAANHKPEVRGHDEAIWRRFAMLPFEQTIAKEARDRELPRKLAAEASGILRWAIEGALAWRKEGLGQPQEVLSATATYRADSDFVAAFLEDRCERDKTSWVSSEDIHREYLLWAKLNDEPQLKKPRLGERIAQAGFEAAKRSGNRGYAGLSLRSRERADAPGRAEAPFPAFLHARRYEEKAGRNGLCASSASTEGRQSKDGEGVPEGTSS